jgi:hypothetical protein
VEDNPIISYRRPKDLLGTNKIGLDWNDIYQDSVHNRT